MTNTELNDLYEEELTEQMEEEDLLDSQYEEELYDESLEEYPEDFQVENSSEDDDYDEPEDEQNEPESSMEDSIQEVLRFTHALCECLQFDYCHSHLKSHKEFIEAGIEVEEHQEILNQIQNDTYDFNYRFEIHSGNKYHKVVSITGDSSAVHCFVDKKTGEVYKAASSSAPAKTVRFNLMDEDSRELAYSAADWGGDWLYLR